MYQKLIVIGRLGRDPEMRYTPAGQPVTSFSIATDRQWSQDGAGEAGAGKPFKETTWFRVITWGKMAEACNNFLQKGKLVMVEGRLSVDAKTGGPRIWEGKEDHAAHTQFEIVAATVKFLSPHTDDGAGQPEEPPVEDIPF